MTTRQKFLKAVYPAYVRLSRLSPNKSRVLLPNEKTIPPVSFYALQGEMRDGTMLDTSLLKGKKVLLVNTASGCGFTEQYDQLQQLFKQYKNQLVVLAFPTNDFGEEKTSDEEIAIFCRENFRVSFPILKKSIVINKKHQNDIFNWLSDPRKNGWNKVAPKWNFCKYLLNEEGLLIGYFGSAIEPMGDEIINAIG
ncbi:MAG: glutathione peroxidase [Chitinophagaceae bacterium]